MTINKISTEQINVALLDLENKIKRNNQTAAISALSNDIEIINKTLKEKQNGLVAGETYNINISGNAATSNHSLTADNATTADSANTATSAGFATNADHANTSDYAASAGSADSAPMIFPEGFVYFQLYNPSTATWEKSPSQMGMQIPSGYKWTEITANFSSYPYLKIGNKTTQDGHNAYHSHTGGNLKIEGEIGTVADGSKQALFSMTGWGGWSSVYHPGYDSYTIYTNNNGHYNLRHNGTNWSGTTSYDGKSNEQTVEVNASGMKIWKVVVDA